MDDPEIRQALIRYLKQHAAGSPKIISEMAVCGGLARVDVAVISELLCGFEIKSDVDTLYRLPQQVECYNKTFDEVTAVVGEKYAEIIQEHIPPWWGIYKAQRTSGGEVEIVKVRDAQQNKNVDSMALLELLWRCELLNLLRSENVKGFSNKNRRIIRKMAVENISDVKIKQFVVTALLQRPDWRMRTEGD